MFITISKTFIETILFFFVSGILAVISYYYTPNQLQPQRFLLPVRGKPHCIRINRWIVR